jgi:hypothetical protein
MFWLIFKFRESGSDFSSNHLDCFIKASDKGLRLSLKKPVETGGSYYGNVNLREVSLRRPFCNRDIRIFGFFVYFPTQLE